MAYITKPGSGANTTAFLKPLAADEFIRAVAQHQVKPLWHLGVTGQGNAQVIDTPGRVTVQRQSAQTLPQCLLQRGRQRVRVFHRIKFDHAAGVLHHVSVHGLHIGADALGGHALGLLGYR
jgi:hypothetical protein